MDLSALPSVIVDLIKRWVIDDTLFLRLKHPRRDSAYTRYGYTLLPTARNLPRLTYALTQYHYTSVVEIYHQIPQESEWKFYVPSDTEIRVLYKTEQRLITGLLNLIKPLFRPIDPAVSRYKLTRPRLFHSAGSLIDTENNGFIITVIYPTQNLFLHYTNMSELQFIFLLNQYNRCSHQRLGIPASADEKHFMAALINKFRPT